MIPQNEFLWRRGPCCCWSCLYFYQTMPNFYCILSLQQHCAALSTNYLHDVDQFFTTRMHCTTACGDNGKRRSNRFCGHVPSVFSLTLTTFPRLFPAPAFPSWFTCIAACVPCVLLVITLTSFACWVSSELIFFSSDLAGHNYRTTYTQGQNIT